MSPANRIWTVGHSTHTLERFLALLKAHAINAVADVRSAPYSQRNPQFDRETLAQALAASGIQYIFLGAELGARSDDPSCFENNRVRYDRLAKKPAFLSGLERIREASGKYRLALLCAEKEPLNCHRTILVSRHLAALGVAVEHILANGEGETHDQAIDRLRCQLNLPSHDLFRSHQEVVEDAYRLQERRIAYLRNDSDLELTHS